MKKKNLLLSLGISIFLSISFSIKAQDSSTDLYSYYNSIEKKHSELSSEQVKELKELKKEIGRDFESINKNKDLLSIEKRKKKQELKRLLNSEIDRIVDANRIIVDDEYDIDSEYKDYSNYRSYGSNNNYYANDKYYDELARIEAKIESIERQLDANNDNDYISKYERKSRKAALKNEKSRLKAERDIIKRRYKY